MSAPAVQSVEETCSPEKMILFDNKETEKQISVDPISVMKFPLTTDPRHHQRLLTAKSTSKFISCSLPNSASSSPCLDLAFTKHKKKNPKNHHEAGPLARQHSVALGNLERLRESHLRKSKSCGEGRACQPSVDFDMWASQSPRNNQATQGKREEGRHTLPSKEGEFKCGACLFLPGLGKSKTVRARKEVGADRGMAHMEDLIASQRVSLEKFECGSWRSSAIINCEEDGGDAASSRFFDLPVELIRCSSSVNDAESPVTAGFMFDNKLVDHHRNRKGVLKSRKSQEAASSSPRHVRFSAAASSSPTSSCVTPRIHRARDEFSAFLEAQSA